MELKQRQRLFAQGLLLIAVPVNLLLAVRLGMPAGPVPSQGQAIFWTAASLGTLFAGIVGVARLNASRAGTLANPLAAGAAFFSLIGVLICGLAAALALLSFGSLVHPGGRLFGGN